MRIQQGKRSWNMHTQTFLCRKIWLCFKDYIQFYDYTELSGKNKTGQTT